MPAGAAGVAGAVPLFSAGAVVCGGVVVAGGVVVVGAGVVAFAGTTDLLPGLADTIVSAREVSMKIKAAAVVAFERIVPLPRCPKAVWLEPPPKVPDQSALFPCCSSTTRIRNRQTMT